MAAVHSVSAAARRQWQRQRRWRLRNSATARCRRQLGGAAAKAAASAPVAAARSAAAAHSATVAARWQQRGGCGGFSGTVRECADARAFERHRRANICVLVLGQGRRDDSANGIVVVSSEGGARGDVHRGCQCAAAAGDDAADEDTADADGDGEADDIVC